MFERYTEKARRTIFYARYEASQAGSPYIETEHLLLGLLRESSGVVRQHLKIDPARLTSLIRAKPVGPKISTSVDLPLDDASKRALAYAAEEAEQMGHKFIGTERLLLGVMREEQGEAAKALQAAEAPSVTEVRKSISESAPEQGGGIFASGSPRLPTYVKFIEEDSGRELSARPGFEIMAPRIGEAVLISPEEGTVERFRVIDVEWKFDVKPPRKDLMLLKVVEVRLKREQPAR